MDLTLVYALVLLGNITFVVLLNAAHTLYRKLSWKIKLWNLAYLRCHFSITRRKYLQSVTIAKALLFVGLLVGLALLNAIGLNDRTEARRRTGLLCIIHAVPLYITAHMGLAADILGIKLSRMRLFHTLAGLVCCFEGIAHVILSIDTIPVREGVGLFGLLVGLLLSQA